uniref:Uncharacterized protein n=1 Tax=Arion vulgaris TaxID=1028688 RepID=A0A0B7BKI4_9EUPU
MTNIYLVQGSIVASKISCGRIVQNTLGFVVTKELSLMLALKVSKAGTFHLDMTDVLRYLYDSSSMKM